MKRTEYCEFPEQLNHVRALIGKDLIIVNSNFPEGKETVLLPVSQLPDKKEDK